MNRRLYGALALASVLAAVPFVAFAQNVTVKDAAGATQTLCTKLNTSVNTPCAALVDSAGGDITDPTLHAAKTEPVAGENHIGEFGGHSINASATFTTPSGTTAYVVGNQVSNSATAGSVTPLAFTVCRVNGGTGLVRRARIKIADTGFANAVLRLHLYQTTPTSANGDHAAYSTTESNWMGDFDVTLDHVFSDPMEKGTGIPASGAEVNFDCATGTTVIYGLLEARTAVTPVGAKAVTVLLETLVN